MPITPFHFGPGLLLKGTAPSRVSLAAFVAANVIIDIESFYYLTTNAYPVHRELHTFVGASAVAVVTVLLGLVARKVVRSYRPTTAAIVAGSTLGALTHPLLDGIMHRDILPLRPWSDSNPLQGMLSLSALHQVCAICAVIGGALWLMRWTRDSNARSRAG